MLLMSASDPDRSKSLLTGQRKPIFSVFQVITTSIIKSNNVFKNSNF